MYEYAATILRVVDGDTVEAEVDLGFDVRHRMKLRLFGINAPEMKTPEGLPAKQHLIALLHPGAPAEALAFLATQSVEVTIRTQKDRQEKYGRYLADIFVGLNTPGQIWVNRRMVDDGFAVVYEP